MKKNLLLILMCLGVLVLPVKTAFALEYFQNADFETGDFDFWDTAGIVSVIEGDSYVADAYEGDYMALISIPGDSGGGDRNYNYIKQNIDAFNGEISFWYNFFTMDYDNDNPGFVVKINGTQVFSLNADDSSLSEYSDPIYYSGWQQFTYDLSSYSGQVEIALYAGNTVDNYNNTWVYVDAFSPNAPAAPVPEPATALLLGSGLGIVAIFRGRKRGR